MELDSNVNTAAQTIPEMKLAIGSLVSVDNANRVGTAAVQGEANFVYVVFSGLASERQSVEITEGYTVGDQVLVAYYRADSMLTSRPSSRGIVICKIAPIGTTFTELLNPKNGHNPEDIKKSEEASPVAKSYIENRTGELFGEDIAQFPATNNLNDFVGQNQNITGDTTNFTVSHSEIAAKAGDAAYGVNEFGVLSSKSLWTHSKNLSTTRHNYLVGDLLMDEEIQTSDLAGSYTRINKFGALSDGVSDALVDKDGNILSRIKHSVDGITKIDVGGAFIVERGGGCVVTQSSDKSPIKPLTDNTVPNIANIKDFDFVEDSLIAADGVESYASEDLDLLAPVDSPTKVAKTAGVKNPVTGRVVDTVAGRCRFGVQTDGSIVFSDAWGSEIRMFGGDIFITPARHVIITSPEDTIISAGGASAVNATKLVNIGSAMGSIELAGKQLNMYGDAVKIAAPDTVTISSGRLLVASENSITVSSGENIDVASIGSISAAAKLCYIVGSDTATVSSSAASVRLKGAVVELGAGQFSVMSNLIVSDRKADGFKLGTISIAPAKGSGFIGCSGHCVVNKGLSANMWIKTNGTLAACAVTVKDVNKEAIGVFKTSHRPETEAIPSFSTISIPDYSSTANVNSIRDGEYSVKNTIKDIFVFEPSSIYTIVPGWFGRVGGSPQPVIIEGGSSGGYIYPGKDFWEKSGAYVINNEEYYNIYTTPAMSKVGMRSVKK